MERIDAELFTDAGNNTVVRVPGRKFPGVLIQGDSLSVHHRTLGKNSAT